MAPENETAVLPAAATTPVELDLTNLPSMDELLGMEERSDFGQGSIVTGKIIEKRDSGVIVDIGFKAEGFVPKDEFPNWETVGEGDQIRALLEQLEDEDNMPRLSVEKAVQQEAWQAFLSQYDEGSIVKGVVRYRVKGGLMVDVGIDAFLPGSQVDLGPVKNLDDFINNEYDFKILKINTDRRNIVISRRELLEAEKARKRATLMAEIYPGQLRKGAVKNITEFGAFIDLNGIDGLLHITDMSWGRVSHPSEMLSVGEEVELVILDVDREKDRVSLGLKQKSPDPWDAVEERHPIESRIKGRVVNVMPYGAFVEIEQGVEGLIHVSEMSWTKRITRATDVINVGDDVEAVVLDIQPTQKKISLGLRQTMENPWQVVAEKYPTGSKVTGTVRNMTSYGAFIEIQEDIDGMVHVSDMSWTRKINNPAEILKKGDSVEAVVLDIDLEQQRISLGIKQLTDDPWSKIDELYKIGDMVKSHVMKLTSFGAFVELDNEIDGLIHISQISEERVEKVKDVLRVGEEVEARVIKIDANERRIGLSMKAAREHIDRAVVAVEGRENLRPGEHMVDVGDIFDTAVGAKDMDTAEEPDGGPEPI
jgi:small subunit ribosomal protein S1